MNLGEKIRSLRIARGMTQERLAEMSGYSTAAISRIENGDRDIPRNKFIKIANALQIAPGELLGFGEEEENAIATFPVIGDIAAGYDRVTVENWDGDTVDIPRSYMHGRPDRDFFVLQIKGDSMYPMYMDGDRVLIQKADTMDFSGQIGAFLYDGEFATIKRIEYVQGEDWVRLVPINVSFPPMRIEGERLEHCRVMGVPKVIIRTV